MLARPFQPNRFPSKNQELSITLPNGRTYAICSKGQYRTVQDLAKNKILEEAASNNITLDDVSLEKKLEEWQETKSVFATMPWVLSKLTPEQAKEWETKYRFQPIQRNISG